MKVGIPTETSTYEQSVAPTPKTVNRLLKQGFKVYIQKGAGQRSQYSEKEYEEAGANLLLHAEDIYSQTDIVLKVQPPTFEEVDQMKEGLVLLSYLWPDQNKDILQKLADKKVNAVAMDAIPRISRAQKMDVRSSMANIEGYRAVVEGAYHFGRFLNGQITAAGKVEPAKVLVVGAGVAGLAAIGTANSLGAIVRAFDTRKEVAEQIESMGAEFLSVDIDEDGSTESGYSKEMSDAFIKAEMALFLEQAKEVDIIITTALIPGRDAPKLILDYHVEALKPGSVIVDLAAPNGGNCTMTRPGEIYTTNNGVTIIGKLNQLPQQASQLYSNNLCHLLDDMGNAENFKIDMEDDVVSRSMVVIDGKINWPVAPLPVSPQTKKVKIKEKTAEEIKEEERINLKKKAIGMFFRLAIIGIMLFIVGQFAPAAFMGQDVVSRSMVVIDGKINWPVAPLPVSPQTKKVKIKEKTAEEIKEEERINLKKKAIGMFFRLAIIGIMLFIVGQFAPAAFMG